MLFKIFYCDDSSTAKHVLAEYQKVGFATGIHDRASCATIEVIPSPRNYAESRITIRNITDREIYTDRLCYWRNYIVVFEDNTVISLLRNFDPREDSKRNHDMLTEFINAIQIKTKPSNDIIIQDDDDDFVV